MNTKTTSLLILLILGLASASRNIVHLTRDANADDIALRAHGVWLRAPAEHRIGARDLGRWGVLGGAEASVLRGMRGVILVEEDHKRYLRAETVPYGIDKVHVAGIAAGANEVTVCVIDTGVDPAHPDIADDVIGNDYDLCIGGKKDECHYHGSHCAGTIAAITGNNEGVSSVDQHGKIRLASVRVFNKQGSWSYSSDVAYAAQVCAGYGAKVVSMSLGGTGSSATEAAAFDALNDAGVLNVAAAGNDGDGANPIEYPSSYPAVVSVGATHANDEIAYFSSHNEFVELSAPGVAVLSTYVDGKSFGYAEASGTSMATPHVAGAAGVLFTHFPTSSPQEIRDALTSTAMDLGAAGKDNFFGYALFKLQLPCHPALFTCPHWTGRRGINSPYGINCLTTLAVKRTASGHCLKVFYRWIP
jgi:serine protease